MNISKFLIIGTLAVCLMTMAASPILAAPPAANLDQAKNGSATSPTSPVDFQNGNLGPSHAHYVEGYSVIYRAVLTDLPTATSITLTLGYDIKHSDRHALDYLTYYDRIDDPDHETVFGHPPETIDPLDGVAGVSGTTTTFQIPKPSSTGSPVTDQPGDSYDDVVAHEGVAGVSMTLFGGTITGIAYVSQGDLTASQSETQINVTFTVDSSTAVLAWGGHIASRADWGFDTDGTPLSAGGISGSPYHMRLLDWNLNNLGNQDRSLQSASVYVPITNPAIEIEKLGSILSFCEGDDPEVTYTYYVENTGDEDLDNVVVTDDTCSPVTGPTGDDGDGYLNPQEIWTYECSMQITGDTLNLVQVDAEGRYSEIPVSNSSEWEILEVTPPGVSVDPVSAEICESDDQTFTAQVTGGVGPFTYSWTKDGSPLVGETGSSITVSEAGDYCVTVTDTDSGCDNSACGTLSVVDAPDCDIDGPDSVCEADSGIAFSTTVDADTYLWSVTGDATIDGSPPYSGTSITVTPTSAAGFTVHLEVCYVDGYECCSTCDKSVSIIQSPDCSIDTGPRSLCEEDIDIPVEYCTSVVADHYEWEIISGPGNIPGDYESACVDVVPTALGTIVLELRVWNDVPDDGTCGNSCQIQITVSDCGSFCSFTQGFWGNEGGTGCDGATTTQIIDSILGEGVLVGVLGERSILFDSAACIISRLPAGGKPRELPVSLGDAQCDVLPGTLVKGNKPEINNVLVGQVVALTLNLRLFNYGCDNGGDLAAWELPAEFCTMGENGCAEKFMIPEPFVGMTVDELLALANDALAGLTLPDGVTIGMIYDGVTAINEGFDECRETIACPTEEICGNGCDDDFDGLVDYDDIDDCPVTVLQ